MLSVSLEHSSVHEALDEEAVKLSRRVQPLPAPPEEVVGNSVELVVAVEFFMR